LLGNIALNLFKKDKITNARGNWIEVKGIPAMPVFHPEYFVQIEGKEHPDIVQEKKDLFVEDIRNVLLMIQEKYPNNNVLLKNIKKI
jgi:uracil-DNA glycosylase